VIAGGADAAPLPRIEAYFDAVPRPAADVEDHGPLTLFVSRIPWRFYGRPRLGLDREVTKADVLGLGARQRALGVREALEWVHETTPSLTEAAAAAGMDVIMVPLLAMETAAVLPAPAVPGVRLRLLTRDDAALPAAQDAVDVAFGGLGGGVAGGLGFLRERLRAGLTGMAVAESADGVLAAGSHQPSGGVSELMGIGTLPQARGRGIGTALTARLVEDARARGARLAFLSAADDDVARLYMRVGFHRVGTACFGRPA